jgi:hypothetical protein
MAIDAANLKTERSGFGPFFATLTLAAYEEEIE